MARTIIVGIDIRDLRIAKTGSKTYLEELCKQFKEENNKKFKFYFIDTFFPVYTGTNLFLKLVEQIRFFIWKQFSLPIIAFFRGCDIVFCTDYFVPYLHLGFTTIPVFHDAFFWEYPEHYNKYWLILFKKLGVAAAKKSAFVVTTTFYAKEKIVSFSGIDPEKIIPVYEAPKLFPGKINQENILPAYISEKLSHPYILHVGTFEKRKNLSLLIKAFHTLINNGYADFRLILVGQSSVKTDMDDSDTIKKLISRYELGDKIFMPGYVSDEMLQSYYHRAFVYVFPSVNEGFGLPVLEAFQHDVPVLVANNTCLPEVGSDAVVTFDPYDADKLFQKIKMVIDEPILKQELIKKGKKRLQLFSWEKTSSHLLQLFENVILNKK
ncbi:4-alpha-N-acetylgalactosaminyltransferase [mine drainage metagenome]|uniref:4-alpha-N-acetylgalactosaminyltransferase n=1 Tax=mine drainage metagenome TaxID=410659 RepID=A0A1J5SF45_9ZZZZ